MASLSIPVRMSGVPMIANSVVAATTVPLAPIVRLLVCGVGGDTRVPTCTLHVYLHSQGPQVLGMAKDY